jgi:hypothetical protein
MPKVTCGKMTRNRMTRKYIYIYIYSDMQIFCTSPPIVGVHFFTRLTPWVTFDTVLHVTK